MKIRKYLIPILICNSLLLSVTQVNARHIHRIKTQMMNLNNNTQISSIGPWETDSNGDPLLQPLHNHNEIYFSINPTSDYQQIALNAASAWNNLDVIRLIQVPWGDTRSQINITSSDGIGPNESADGDTSYNILTITANHKRSAQFNGTQIVWYSQLFNIENNHNRYITALHEFGHALGFAHDNRKLNNGLDYQNYGLIMNAKSYGKQTYPLGGIEQRTLAHYYGLSPAKWLNTNY